MRDDTHGVFDETGGAVSNAAIQYFTQKACQMTLIKLPEDFLVQARSGVQGRSQD